MMIADTRFLDPRTGEVIAEPNDTLDDETLYRLERIAVDAHYQAQVDAIWQQVKLGNISPVVGELRIGRITAEAGWRSAGSIDYRPKELRC